MTISINSTVKLSVAFRRNSCKRYRSGIESNVARDWFYEQLTVYQNYVGKVVKIESSGYDKDAKTFSVLWEDGRKIRYGERDLTVIGSSK